MKVRRKKKDKEGQKDTERQREKIRNKSLVSILNGTLFFY